MADEEKPDKAKGGETIFQKIEWIKLLAFFPAIPVMLLLRRKIGYRTITPNMLIVVSLAIIIGSLLLPMQGSRVPTALFGMLIFILGHVSRYRRWQELRQGASWHTRGTGFSWLESIPFPPRMQFLQEERRIYRILDPLACFLAGLLIWALGSWSLAWCILISGLFLLIWEIGYYERYVNTILDIHDGLVDANVQKHVSDHFTQKPTAPALRLSETAGLPTGLARDIAAKVEQRKRKAATQTMPQTVAIQVS
jgi:hypothetical protein